jgi:hypothetical protein
MKNHPTSEEWMSFLYCESTPTRHAALHTHLRDCADCQRRVATWRGSMAALDAWPPPRPGARPIARPVLRAAAVAVVVLGLGFGIGRVTDSPARDMKQFQATMRAEMDARLAAAREEFAISLRRQRAEIVQAVETLATDAAAEVSTSLLADFAKVMEERLDADHQTFTAALKHIDEQQLSSYASLRNDLDTVAVNADDEISRAQAQLIELAALTRPAGR